MSIFLLYLFKTSICLSIFYLLYKILLAKETFFKLNRQVLLLGIVISFSLPLVTINLGQTSFRIPQLQHLIILEDNSEFIASEELTHSDINVQANNLIPTQKIASDISWLSIVSVIYLLGFVVNCILLLVSYYRMRMIIKRCEKIKQNDLTYYLSQENISPFSWGRYIVVSQNEQEGIDAILMHEQAHSKRLHWVDILFTELLLMFQWFNPLAWKIIQELKDIHEFQVDQDIINLGYNASNYQLLIVKKAVGASSYALANSFNHSKIKKRITMMLKRKSSKRNKLKVLFFVPVALSAIYAFSVAEVNSMTKDIEKIHNPQIEIDAVNDSTYIEKQFNDTVYHPPILVKDIKRICGYGMMTDPIYNVPIIHVGDDYIADKGSKIYAVKDGVVSVMVSNSKTGYGNHVIIDHGNGVETVYAHNDRNLVEVGDKVKMGQVIALVGSTGKSTEPHLHFEIRKNGKPFNPKKFMLMPTSCKPISEITVEYTKEDISEIDK